MSRRAAVPILESDKATSGWVPWATCGSSLLFLFFKRISPSYHAIYCGKEITLAGSPFVCFLQFAWKNPSGAERKLLLLCGAVAFTRMNEGGRGALHILPDLRLGLNKRGGGLLLREGDDMVPVFEDSYN